MICGGTLGRSILPPGTRGGSLLLCSKGLLPVSIFVKECSDPECRTRHPFRNWESGIYIICYDKPAIIM